MFHSHSPVAPKVWTGQIKDVIPRIQEVGSCCAWTRGVARDCMDCKGFLGEGILGGGQSPVVWFVHVVCEFAFDLLALFKFWMFENAVHIGVPMRSIGFCSSSICSAFAR